MNLFGKASVNAAGVLMYMSNCKIWGWHKKQRRHDRDALYAEYSDIRHM